MRNLTLVAWVPVILAAQQIDESASSLDRVAAVATAMVDGDVCSRIETERSRRFALATDPRDPWRASDNYDVDHPAFIATKKTLMRLARLCETPCDVNLWMPLAGGSRVQVVIRNVHELSQFWPWGALNQDMPAEMKRVLDTGERVTVRKRPAMISVLLECALVEKALGGGQADTAIAAGDDGYFAFESLHKASTAVCGCSAKLRYFDERLSNRLHGGCEKGP